MKILFLDVDGVLNCRTTKERQGVVRGVEPSKCERIRRIVRETGCKIVLSSTWRKHPHMLPYLHRELGDATAALAGITPILGTLRGEEIQSWLNSHDTPERFVIVDDDADMCHLEPYLVRTDDDHGLTDELTDEIIKRLNG